MLMNFFWMRNLVKHEGFIYIYGKLVGLPLTASLHTPSINHEGA
jgi:hypothetical protein